MIRRLARLSAATIALATAAGLATAQDSRTLRLSHVFPEGHFLWQEGGKVFADAVTEATGGAVGFELYHAGQLGNDQLTALNAGLADIIIMPTVYSPDKLPLSGVVELPGFISGSCEGADRFWTLAQDGGTLDRLEYAPQNLHVLFAIVPPPYKVMTAKKEVATLDDLAGLKLRTVGGAQADTVRALGGTPVQVQAPEFYDAVARGTVDGAIYAFVGMPPFDLGELFNYTVDGVFAGSVAVLVMMKDDAWNALPDDTKTALSDAGAKAQEAVCQYQDNDENAIRDKYIAEEGLQMTSLDESEAARWNEILDGVAEAWAQKLADNGRPGKEVLDAYAATGMGN